MNTMFGFAAAAPIGLLHVARARRESAAILMREVPVADRSEGVSDRLTKGPLTPALSRGERGKDGPPVPLERVRARKSINVTLLLYNAWSYRSALRHNVTLIDL